MKALVALSTLVLAAGCATTENTQVASVDCKVYPATTASATGARRAPVSDIEQRYAQMQLASSDYRMRNLREHGLANNNVEDALRDCNR